MKRTQAYSRRRRHRRSKRWPLLACGIMLAAAWLWQHLVPKTPMPPAAAEIQVPVRAASMRVLPRAVYPYSVLRGGAWSRAELVHQLELDPVAAAHYRDFHAAQSRVEHLDESRTAYVSYRVRDTIYWTRHPVTLAAGEAVLSDGDNLARARCGNRISFSPRQPVRPESAVELDPELQLNTPEPLAPSGADEGEGAASDVFHVPLLVHDLFPPYFGSIGTGEEGAGAGYAGGFATGSGGFAPLLEQEEAPAPGAAGPLPGSEPYGAPYPVLSFAPPGLPGLPATPPVHTGGGGGAPSGSPVSAVLTLLSPTPGYPCGVGGEVPGNPGGWDGGEPPGGGQPPPPDHPPGPPPPMPPGIPPPLDIEVPEPAAGLLLAVGVFLLAVRAARKRS